MKIRYRIALQFTLIVAFILLVFSTVVYLKAESQRQQNFYDRLQRAFTTARLLVDVREFDSNLLKLIDKNSSSKLPNETIFVFNYKNELIYSNVEQRPTYITTTFLNGVRLNERIMLQIEQRSDWGSIFRKIRPICSGSVCNR